MSYWLIELEGTEKALNFLRKYLTTPEFSIVDFQHRICIKVPHLGDDTDSNSLRLATNRFIEVINGAALLLWPHYEKVKSNTIHRVSEDGSLSSIGFLTAREKNNMLYAFKPDDPTLSQWISLAKDNPSIENALFLYCVLEHDWKGLYMVLEVIKDDLGSWKSIVSKGWISNSQLRNLKNSANSFSAVGDLARHATNTIKPPSKPMTLPKAKEIVDSIVIKWLASKSHD